MLSIVAESADLSFVARTGGGSPTGPSRPRTSPWRFSAGFGLVADEAFPQAVSAAPNAPPVGGASSFPFLARPVRRDIGWKLERIQPLVQPGRVPLSVCRAGERVEHVQLRRLRVDLRQRQQPVLYRRTRPRRVRLGRFGVPGCRGRRATRREPGQPCLAWRSGRRSPWRSGRSHGSRPSTTHLRTPADPCTTASTRTPSAHRRHTGPNPFASCPFLTTWSRPAMAAARLRDCAVIPSTRA